MLRKIKTAAAAWWARNIVADARPDTSRLDRLDSQHRSIAQWNAWQ